MAKAKIEPPKAQKLGKGEPPIEPSANLEKLPDSKFAPMNFNVPAAFKKQYKAYALDNDKSMVQLLMETFEFYRQHKG